jgi:hypothetical protein
MELRGDRRAAIPILQRGPRTGQVEPAEKGLQPAETRCQDGRVRGGLDQHTGTILQPGQGLGRPLAAGHQHRGPGGDRLHHGHPEGLPAARVHQQIVLVQQGGHLIG